MARLTAGRARLAATRREHLGRVLDFSRPEQALPAIQGIAVADQSKASAGTPEAHSGHTQMGRRFAKRHQVGTFTQIHDDTPLVRERRQNHARARRRPVLAMVPAPRYRLPSDVYSVTWQG